MKIISFDQAFQDITKEVTKIPRKEYLSHGQFPIVDQGDGEIAGYTNCGKGLYTEVPVVLFGDHTRVFKYINFPFFAGADGTKILKAKFGTDAHFGYYSFMQYPLISLGYSRHFKLLKERMFHTFDYATQLRIAAILGSIDEKIELNRKKIAELEALAKTIYDYWFVQFDFPDKNGKPYKSSGGKMVWNEQLKREIPEGWEVKKLSNYTVKITKGTTPTSIGASFSESGIRFIKVENIINGYLISTPETFISHDIHMRMSRSSLEKNDLLITIAGRLGDVAIVPEQILPANTNQAVGIIRFKHEFIKTVPYVHAYLSSKQMYSKIQNLNAQSIQKNLNLEIVGQIDVLFDSVVVNHFSTFMETIFEDIFYLQEYNHKLISLRDTLLPLLMNGQVEVK